MNVALYVRRSTIDLQPDSLAAQEERLRSHAAASGHDVVRVYSDSASGKRVEKRDAFQRLIDDVKRGPDFQAVLVRDVSRWSRAENTDEAGYYEFICRSHGVQVLYADEAFGPDQSPYALLLKSVKRAMAAEFSLEKARVVRSSAARLVRQGFWPTGSVPYAMKRVLVDSAGNQIRTLEPGDRKALSNQRTKLAPGDPREVQVIRRIFDAYASGRSVAAIASDLAADGILSPRGSCWTPSMVSYVLQNEAYAGTLVYWFRNGDKPSAYLDLRDTPSDRIIRSENAHPGIVEAETWTAVQARLRLLSTRKSDEMLLDELRAARSRWRPGQRRPAEIVTGRELRRGYGRPDAEIITARTIREATGRLVEALKAEMHVTPFEGGYLLDHLLHVGIRLSLPHARIGRLRWNFPLTGAETEDALLCLAFSPPPFVEHVETFVLRVSRSARPAWSLCPPVTEKPGSPTRSRYPATVVPFETLRHAIRFRSHRAEARLLAALQGRPAVSLEAVAIELSWPVDAARTLYRKLELRGETVPPLTNGIAGRHLTVVCPHCLKARKLSPKVVLSLTTDVCFECLHRTPVRSRNPHVAVCPKCGIRRLRVEGEIPAGEANQPSVCHRCQRKPGAERLPKQTAERAQE
ncbi:recombinase family protein [Acidobacteria bacterium ACD]|nr:recombinase family protein [Acidobacteria bacterium ACB2]MDL1948629.1 recombinase family protein [Acidobacteria bacterium ACD]